MKEVFYVMGHGLVQTTEVLDHRQRLGIPIISLGTEGHLTYPCPSMLLIPYYMKIHGNVFMNRLLAILLQYGEKYDTQFEPNETKLEKDVRFLFDINHEERKIYPQNVFRAYSGSDNILNTSITSFRIPDETFFYDAKLFHNTKKFTTTHSEMKSSPNSQYTFNEITFPNRDQFFSLINPFGIFKFDEQKRTFDMTYRMTEAIHHVKDLLQEIRRQSTNIPIVFMIHCKEPDKKILVNLDLKKNPLEKFHKRSLQQMMKALTIKSTPTPPHKKKTVTSPPKPIKTTPTRKRKKSKQTTIRKSSLTTPPTKRTKTVLSPPTSPVPMDISPPRTNTPTKTRKTTAKRTKLI